MEPCFLPANILLPSQDANLSKWAVIACDQFTSQPEYWRKAAEFVGDAPSALNIVYPEAYLSEGDQRIKKICTAMRKYLDGGILTQQVTGGFILVERQVSHGTRLGLVGRLDLDQYEFTPGAQVEIRATEGTVLSRIPPRVKIRKDAPIETPHAMVLIDDAKKQLLEPLDAEKEKFRPLYSFDLMLNGGHIAAWAIEGAAATSLAAKIAQMQSEAGGFFIAVGDGNHSIATAKTCWEELKKTLTPAEKKTHPARWTLVELGNLHDPSLVFEPVHRLITGPNTAELPQMFKDYLTKQGMKTAAGRDVVFTNGINDLASYSIDGLNGRLPVDLLQKFLDEYLQTHKGSDIDYIHGESSVKQLAKDKQAIAILLGALDKNTLFPAIAAGGVLPRKTFSMGEAEEKRYYIECRRIA